MKIANAHLLGYGISDTKGRDRRKLMDREILGSKEGSSHPRQSTACKRIDKAVVIDRIVLISLGVTDRMGHGPDFHTIRSRRSDPCHQDDQSILSDLSS